MEALGPPNTLATRGNNGLGDSITEGVAGTTPYRSTNWPSELRDILTADGSAGQVGEGVIMVSGQTQSNYDPQRTIATGWARTGAFYSNVLTSNSVKSGTKTALSLALPTCDTIKLVYMQHNAVGGTYTYQVDGGTAVTVNSTGTPRSRPSRSPVSASARTR